MSKKIISIILSVILILSVFAGCSSSKEAESTTSSGEKKLSVVCTIFPQYDFVRAVAGDKVDLTMLLSPESESHSYEPSLSDISKIKNADIFIYVGGETDKWVNDVLKDNTSSVKTISLLSLVEALEESDEGIVSTEEEEEDGAKDEHVWTSLKNASAIVNSLADTLSKSDEKNSAYYKENAKAYSDKLSALDKEYEKTISSKKNKTIVIADRNPFRYLFHDYGIHAIAAFNGCTSNTEITLDVMNELVKAIESNKLSTVFVIELNKSTYADSICKETGATKKTLNSCHNLTKDDFNSGKTYYDLMKENLETLKGAMN